MKPSPKSVALATLRDLKVRNQNVVNRVLASVESAGVTDASVIKQYCKRAVTAAQDLYVDPKSVKQETTFVGVETCPLCKQKMLHVMIGEREGMYCPSDRTAHPLPVQPAA